MMEGSLASWDVFHAERLELERDLSTAAVRSGLATGDLRDDDLIRPAGTTVAWARLADMVELSSAEPPLTQAAPPAPEPIYLLSAEPTGASASAPLSDFEFHSDEDVMGAAEPAAPAVATPDLRELLREAGDVSFPVVNDPPAEPKRADFALSPAEENLPGGWLWAEEDDGEEDDDEIDGDYEDAIVVNDAGDAEVLDALEDDLDPDLDLHPDLEPPVSGQLDSDSQSSRVALPVVTLGGWDDTGMAAEAEQEEDFSLSRSGPTTVEELDLAPMVDVAFQLVLFFMVTATTVLYKTLEIPKPNSEQQAPSTVAQGRSLEDLQDDYILVEIDPSGAMKIDREPVPANLDVLVERLRATRDKTHRKAMLLSADYATKHHDCVLAIDAAIEIGLGIVLANPKPPEGPAPTLLPGSRSAPAPPAIKSAPAPPAASSGPPI